jgi:hypothetical protein
VFDSDRKDQALGTPEAGAGSMTTAGSIAAASILTARVQTEADHFGNKLKDSHPYRGLGGAVRSRPLEGLAAFLTRN